MTTKLFKPADTRDLKTARILLMTLRMAKAMASTGSCASATSDGRNKPER